MKELNGIAYSDTEKHIGRRKAVPVIYLQGSHYEVGYDSGRIFASVIKNFLATFSQLREYEKVYKTDAGIKSYELTLSNMKKRYPQYVNELRGVADGANVPFSQLFLLQMDDLMGKSNYNHLPKADTGGCSSVGINHPNNSVLGHTEDALSETLNHFYIMSAHIKPTQEDKAHGAVEERFASLCYAGTLPGYTMGYNENGLVFSINTLSPLVLKQGNTPRTFITRALLAAKNFYDAERILIDEGLGSGNGFSVNMLWTDSWGARQLYNVEVAPDMKSARSLLNVHKYDKEPLVHCNRYQRINVTEVRGNIINSSTERLQAIQSHPSPKNRNDIQDILSDQSGKDFYVFQEEKDAPVKTIAAGVFDLEKRTWSIYINKPNISEPVAVLPIRFSMIDNAY